MRDRARGDVGGRADLQRDPVLGEVRQELRVLRGAGAVPDALGAQLRERVPDRLGPGGLARVRHGAQPGRYAPVEVRLELRPRHADLGTAQPEGDQSLGAQPVVTRQPRGLLGRREPGLAGDVEAPAQHGAEVGLGRLARVLDRVHEGASSMPRRVEEYGVMVSSA